MYYPNPNSIDWPKTKEGGLRRLRLGEINLASSLFGYSIHYHQVWIHYDSYLPFNLQPSEIGMSPNGEMWFRADKYEDDFSVPKKDSADRQHLFMHEMMHIWQHQRGMWVRTRGLFSRVVSYEYTLDKSNLLEYGLEQQASIVSDYWLLKTYGYGYYRRVTFNKESNSSEPIHNLLNKYEQILGSFPV